jgi:hypothetical protein
LKLISKHNSLVNRFRLIFTAHRSRVTGRPAPSGLSFTFYNSIAQLPHDVWDNANSSNDIFLSTKYLSALEQAPPATMGFRYVVVSKDDIPVGIAYFQIVELNHRLHRSPLRLLRVDKKSFIGGVHDKIADGVSINILVCGNVLLSGEHGFSISGVPHDTALHAIAEISYKLRKSLPRRISVTLIKDFYNNKVLPSDMFSRFGYYAFDAGANMIVPVRKNWTDFDAYVNEMKSKYRRRAAGAIKKGAAVRRQNLDLADIIKYKDEIFSLYCQVLKKAKLKIFVLAPDYFAILKARLPEQFVCEGYFLNEKMIGFTTRICNGSVMEGYSHGLDYESNKTYELYQNFLLDDMRSAIAARLVQVNTGRTSIAMKSSIGAVPSEMTCYMRFSGKISNNFIKLLFHFIKPSSEYCRNPFEE